jgi:parvulin-like peptidyl-prolyl isomerase
MKKVLIIVFLTTILFGKNYQLNKNDLDFISFYEYKKAFKDLNSKQQQFVKNKLIKRLKVIDLAKKNKLENTKEFKKELEKAKNGIYLDMYVKRKLNTFKISDREIKNYYNKHIKNFTKVHAYTIVKTSNLDIEKYIKILQNIPKKDRLQKFTELAKKYSNHPKNIVGGDLGYIRYNTMAEPFGEVAFSLKKGEFNKKPFKTTLGWHLVYVKDIKIEPLKKAKNKIVSILKRKKLKEWYDNL